jgi:hypothetical protein
MYNQYLYNFTLNIKRNDIMQFIQEKLIVNPVKFAFNPEELSLVEYMVNSSKEDSIFRKCFNKDHFLVNQPDLVNFAHSIDSQISLTARNDTTINLLVTIANHLSLDTQF